MQDKIRIDMETGLMIDAVSPYEFGEDIIETPCLIPFYLPKWDGEKWVEGLTPEEIHALKPAISYEQLVSDLIRVKYTIDKELAINRQRDTKPEEFQEYFDFCEQCKQKAHESII